MNIYVVVEGNRTEREVYQYWIPYVNPNLKQIDNVADFDDNHFIIYGGGGYPNYFEIIENAIEDINTYRNIQRLVIAIDSEEMSFEDKYAEVKQFVEPQLCRAEIRIVVQHFCFETWALGNRKIIGRSIRTEKLSEYTQYYNVTTDDPELLPAYSKEGLGRVRFALKYLNLALHEQYNSLSYSKRKPHALCNPAYFAQVKTRATMTDHIQSFHAFLDAFR